MSLEPSTIHAALCAYSASFDARVLLTQFEKKDQLPEADVILNFLGAKIPPRVFPSFLNDKVGTVELRPNPGNWHADIAEWASALRSVVLASDTYRIVELGCGWGCWITNMGVAAKQLGLEVDLIGVEGMPYHLDSARDVLARNGFHPDEYRLLAAVAGPNPGKAIFPSDDQNGGNFGSEPIFYPSEEELAKYEKKPGYQVLDCCTLEEICEAQPIDLLHIDIQGAETDFVRSNIGQMSQYVRRVLIGTHSRNIEGALIEFFTQQGWEMEMERPCICEIFEGRPHIRIDGVQLWANPSETIASTT